jgi:hypothetical protein
MRVVVNSNTEKHLGDLASGDIFRFEEKDDYYLFLATRNDEYRHYEIFNLCTNVLSLEDDGCMRVISFPNAVIQIR